MITEPRFVICLTNDSAAWKTIFKLSKSSAMCPNQHSYYMGKDRKTGKRRYIVERKCCDELKKLIDCEIWEVQEVLN